MKQLHQRLIIFGLAVANILIFFAAFLLLGGFQTGADRDIVLPTLAQLSEQPSVHSIASSIVSEDTTDNTMITDVPEVAIQTDISPSLEITESRETALVAANSISVAQSGVVPPGAVEPSDSTVTPTMNPVTTPVPQEIIPERVVINFTAGMTDEEKAAYLRSINATILQEFPELGAVVISLPQANTVQFNALTRRIGNSEPDYVARAAISIPTTDTYFGEQWSLDVIGATQAWEVMPANARTVVIAVIDSGVCADHPDLVGRILPGADLVDGDNDPNDEFDHGCGVIGVIAANIDNGIGIAGVAPNTMILPIRVLDENGVGSYSNVARAIVDAANHGVDIINLSLGGSNDSQLLRSAIDYAVAKGVMIIAAAGNTSSEQILFPASYEPVIAVGSVDASLQQSAFSSRSPQIDLWAPGENIHVIHQSDSYDSESGTSFAAPHVSGVAALEIALGSSLGINGRVVHVSGGNVIPTPAPTATLVEVPETVPPQYEPLLARVREEGHLWVIIALDAPFNPDMTDSQILDREILNIQQVRNQVSDLVSPFQIGVYSDAENWTIPFTALKVNDQAFRVLANLDQVVYMFEDVSVSENGADNESYMQAHSLPVSDLSGAGYTVAVLDSGVDNTHPFFNTVNGNLIRYQACFSSDDPTTSLCPNKRYVMLGDDAASPLIENCRNASGSNFCDHGTNVAGVVAQVAPQAKIIAIQYGHRENNPGKCQPEPAPCVTYSTRNQISALNFVLSIVDQRGLINIDIPNEPPIVAVNMSQGSGYFRDYCDTAVEFIGIELREHPLKKLIDRLRNRNVPTIISAGNESHPDGIGQPACISSAVSVGSVTSSHMTAAFSNNSNFLSLFAPGVSIFTSGIDSTYVPQNGTSVSAPFIAGTWALLQQAFPDARIDDVLQALQDSGIRARPNPMRHNLTASGITANSVVTDQALRTLEHCRSFYSVESSGDFTFDQSQPLPDGHTQGTVTLNGWSLTYLNDDRQVRTLGVKIDNVFIDNGVIRWRVSGQILDDNSDDPFRVCHTPLVITWGANVNASVESGFWSTVTGTGLLSAPHYQFERQPSAVLPTGFNHVWNTTGDPAHDILQLGFNFTPSETQAVFKDKDLRPSSDLLSEQTVLYGHSVDYIHTNLELFPRSICSDNAHICGDDSEVNHDNLYTETVIYPPLDQPPLSYDIAYPVLTGWDLFFPFEHLEDRPIRRAGVWISVFDYRNGRITYTISSTIRDSNVRRAFSSRYAVSILGINYDSDNDGVIDAIESNASNNGDGNADGIPDSEQANVTSLPNAVDGRYVTLVARQGIFKNVTAIRRDPPSPDVILPVGLFSFDVVGIETGSQALVDVILPADVSVDTYYKLRQSDNAWMPFALDAESGTGGTVSGNRVLLRLRDGQRGDFDGIVNGTISDPGGPALFTNRLPVIEELADQVTLEGTVATITFSVTDPEGDPFTVTASIGTITPNADLTYTWTHTSEDGPADSQLVVITASDGKAVAATRGFELTVENVAPTAMLVNQSGTVKATDPATLTFTEPFDPSQVDTAAGFFYSFDCESDGVWEVVQGSEPTFGCAYPKMGVYTATGRIEDKDGGFTDYTVEVEVRLKLVAPETSYRLCSLDRQLETIQVLGLTDQQLKGQVIVSYITGLESRGQVDGGWYSVDHNGPADFTLTIEYPGLWDWQYFRHPLYGHPIGALHIDLQIEVLDADGNFIREEDGSVYTLAPGEDWGIWCMKTMLMDIQQPSLTVNEGLLAINLGRVSNRGVYTVSYGTVQENDDGSIIWQATPDDGPSQSQLVTIKACDLEFGGRGCTEVAFDLTVQNVAPTGQFVAVPDYIPPGAGTTLTLTDVVDPSRADTIAGFSYSFDCTNDGVYEITDSRDASAQCLYPTHGDYTAVARVQDKDGGYTDYVVPVIVNTDPVLTLAQSSVSTRENEPVSLAGLATDADGNLLTPTASIGMVTISPDGSLLWSYVPTDGPAENQTVTITVNDGHRGVVSQSFELVVENVAPTAEMGAQPSTVAVGLPVLITLTNPDDPSSTDAAAGFRFSFDCTNDGTFDLEDTTLDTFACIYTEVGTQTVLGRIKDKDGGFTDYTAIVTTTNQAPVISIQQQSVTGNEGQTVLNLGAATDPDGHTITLHASVGDVILHPDGSMVWSLLTTDGPVDSQEVSVTASDGFGGTSLVTFQLVVTNVPPIAVFNSSSATGIAGETINFSFTNQSDVSYQDASVGFTYEFDCDGDNVFEVNGGSLSIHGCSFGQVGTYTVMGRIYDKDAMFTEYLSQVTIMQPQANLLVTVVAPNHVQVGDTGSFILTVSNLGPNVATDVRLLNVIPAGLVLQSALPQQGSCDSMILCQLGTLAPGSSATVQVMVTFSTQGLVTFTVSASSDPMDTDLSNNQVTITTEVQSVPVNQPPVAGNDSVEAAGGTSTVVNVLSNDTDPDGDVLTVVSVNISSGGSVQINADQSILIAPDAEYVGTLEITYVISDGKGGQASGIVLVTVLN